MAVRIEEKYDWLKDAMWVSDNADGLYLDEVPEGWEEFTRKVLADIDKHQTPDFRIVQIKEKYGHLRIYAQDYTDEIDDIIDRADYDSSRVCAHCGATAEYTRTVGWILPLCRSCVDADREWRQTTKKPLELEYRPIKETT